MLEERDGYNYPTLAEFYTETPLNNAFLVTLKLYTVDVETYVMVYERHGRDLAKMVEFFKGVGRLDDDPAAYVRRWLDTVGARAAAAAGPTL